MEPILDLWLVDVPEYAVIFSQYTLICQLTGVYNTTLYTPMTASGRLKENSYASVFVTIFGIVGLYFMFKAGWDVMWVQYMAIFQSVVYAFVVKPAILCKYVPNYTWKEIMLCTWQMIKVSIAPVFIAIVISRYLPSCNMVMMISVCAIIMLSVCASSFAFMDKGMRSKLITIIKQRLHKK
jgi:hypothetical protein